MLSKILQSYLKFWSVQYLTRTKPKIVAITGSVGKTSVKEAVFAVLFEQFGDKVIKSEGNLNTETGVPLAILGFKKSPANFLQWLPIVISTPIRAFIRSSFSYLVLEMAADKPGDIKYLTSFVKPNIAVVTAIGPSHLSAFGTMDKIVEEKTSILWALPQDGWAVLNIDDENVRKASYGGRWKKMTYALEQKQKSDFSADLTARNIKTVLNGNEPQTNFEIFGKINMEVSSETLGTKANVLAMLAATAVANILEISPEKIKKGLAKIGPQEHRMQVFAGQNDTIIIDDSYNANPLSMTAALETLKNLKAKRKIAVLGDMREIGSVSDEAHKKVGELAMDVADIVVGVGDLARKYNASKYFKTRQKAIEYLLKEIRTGDILLVKASRAIGLEEVVEALKVK